MMVSGHCLPNRAPRARPIVIALLAITTTCLLTGCGRNGGLERVVVSGTVTYNGQPIENGFLMLVPTDPMAGPSSGTQISAGRYRLEQHGGAPVGRYNVVIEVQEPIRPGANPRASSPPGASGGAVRRVNLSERCCRDAPLQMTVDSGSGPVVKDFDLTEPNRAGRKR